MVVSLKKKKLSIFKHHFSKLNFKLNHFCEFFLPEQFSLFQYISNCLEGKEEFGKHFKNNYDVAQNYAYPMIPANVVQVNYLEV